MPGVEVPSAAANSTKATKEAVKIGLKSRTVPESRYSPRGSWVANASRSGSPLSSL